MKSSQKPVARITREDLNSRSQADLRQFIVEDIRRKGLRDGDRYLGAEGVGQLLGVSTVTANRLLATLAQEQLLIRRRKAGTFIGPGFIRDDRQRREGLRVLHLLMVKEGANDRGMEDRWSDVLWKLVPGAALRIHQLPEDESYFHARHIIGQIAATGLAEAVVMIRATERIQHLAAEHGIQAVAFGHLYPGVTNLASVTMDQNAAGRLSTSYCLDKGARALLVVMRPSWRMGDADFFNAILQQAGSQGIDASHIHLLIADEDPATCQAQISAAIKHGAGPLGIICRHGAFARATRSAQAASRTQRHIYLVNAAADHETPQIQGCPEILTTLNREAIAAELLKQLDLDPDHARPPVIIPVKLG